MGVVGLQFSSNNEPYVEVTESEGEVVLAAEFPGVESHELAIKVSPKQVKLEVQQAGTVVYHAMFQTPKVKPEESQITFRNGVLEIRTPRA